jgi:CRISPR/Cas system-associated protein Csm6
MVSMLFAFTKKKRQEPSPQLSVSSTSLSAAAGLINLKGEKPMPRHTLISTVGTSLLESNLRRLAEKDFPKPDNWEELYGAFQKENWKAVASKLLELSPGDRVCGAEINTVEEIFKKGMNYIRSIFFLISDTRGEGRPGNVLRPLFLSRKELKLDTVECHVIEKLQDENPKVFKTHGLRTLSATIGALVQRTGGPEFVNIDATGGYKAQIALAVIMGQSLGSRCFTSMNASIRS